LVWNQSRVSQPGEGLSKKRAAADRLTLQLKSRYDYLSIYKTHHEISSLNYSSFKKNGLYEYRYNKIIKYKKDPLIFLVDIYNQIAIGDQTKYVDLLPADPFEKLNTGRMRITG